jgi:acyl-CoA synthetase (AMP-forming)/AMP-acid ligase II
MPLATGGCYLNAILMVMQMLWQRLTDWTKRSPAQEAIVTPSQRLTYGELAVAAEAIAAHLIDCGIRRGDRVAIFLANGIGFVSSFFAICRSGAVAVPQNVKYQPEELHFYLRHSKSRLVITDMARFAHLPRVVDRLEPRPQMIRIAELRRSHPF